MPRDQVVRSGFVYLGQFIAHDISRELGPLAEAGPETERTWNYRSPRLDLEVLYGGTPATTPYLYESDGRLKLGLTEPSEEFPAAADDLPRDAEGNALVHDPRSDDNLLIAQIHVLWAKIHNRVCDLLTEQPTLVAAPESATLFEQARRFVTWHYQWIVRHELLPLIVPHATLREIECDGLRLFPRTYTSGDAPIALPIEFTLAAFRFGHAMVRADYFLNPVARIVEAVELITLTGRAGGILARLPARFAISWPRFFGGSNALVNRGESIDTFITPALYDFHALAPTAPGKLIPSLPEMTLRRGSRTRLPSGQEFARHFGYPELTPDSIAARPEDQAFFRESGLRERTPLWYYLLREAALEGVYEAEPDGRHKVQKMGPIGGRIVAETFYQILNADADSIVHAGKSWRPPAFIFGDFDGMRKLESMQEIARFADPGR
ncbi:MAG: peroxidase family protein [Spartobacteria bacterium]